NILAYDGSLRVGNPDYGFSNYVIPSDWTGQWKHIAVTWDNDKTRLYIDGELVGSYDIGYNNDTHSFGSSIYLNMAYSHWHGNWVNGRGSYDELRISDVARTQFGINRQVAVNYGGAHIAPDAPTVNSPANGTRSEDATPTFTLNAFSDIDS